MKILSNAQVRETQLAKKYKEAKSKTHITYGLIYYQLVFFWGGLDCGVVGPWCPGFRLVWCMPTRQVAPGQSRPIWLDHAMGSTEKRSPKCVELALL